MIDPRKVISGDYVSVVTDFHDYGKTGDLYKIIDSRIPGEETSALGWKIDVKTFSVEGGSAYKLPHDKISLTSRKALSKLVQKALAKVEAKKRAVDREYDVIKRRVIALECYETKEQEVESVLSSTFGFLDRSY